MEIISWPRGIQFIQSLACTRPECAGLEALSGFSIFFFCLFSICFLYRRSMLASSNSIPSRARQDGCGIRKKFIPRSYCLIYRRLAPFKCSPSDDPCDEAQSVVWDITVDKSPECSFGLFLSTESEALVAHTNTHSLARPLGDPKIS